MKYMIDKLKALNTNRACEVGFDTQDEIDWCHVKINGIMKNGYRNAF